MCRGQLDRRRADAEAFRNALFGVAVFTLIVLVNGILAIVLIGFAQAVGWWEVSTSEGLADAVAELSGRLRLTVA